MALQKCDHQAVLAHYLNGASLRDCAKKFGVSMQRCHQIVRAMAPVLMRKPHVHSRRRGTR